jgi:hypothetical protein
MAFGPESTYPWAGMMVVERFGGSPGCEGERAPAAGSRLISELKTSWRSESGVRSFEEGCRLLRCLSVSNENGFDDDLS